MWGDLRSARNSASTALWNLRVNASADGGRSAFGSASRPGIGEIREGVLEVRVGAPPVEGAANEAMGNRAAAEAAYAHALQIDRDRAAPRGDYHQLPLSHLAPGAGA